MELRELLSFLRAQPWAVEASVNGEGGPQAAVVGVAVTDGLEIVFDTLSTSRKAQNLRANGRISLVIGWDEGQTAQIDGVADEPTGNLDTKTSLEIMVLLKNLHAQGNTIILVTHEEDISKFAHRIIRLRDGRIESDHRNPNPA